ncbi:PleD family two-component system response regulator [Sphingobacterium sp. BIGb0116]|uniref:response regulator n=1 Tax=Sphingobacterium sp. BIGb0116 TaxID=2940619 RepID=UPI002167CE10|nr:response regulator [Sphingobacterium sp. BIGb0116]MCS4166294.1 CheY-like chemotaxis protein [Sphingobacterium sp. BIGb0116]
MQIHDLKPKQSRVFSVLHADSDLLMRKIISKVFSNEAFQLDSAANGKEAFALLEARDYQYDIVITEMHMQYANGYEIINKVLKESPRTRTIITSNMSYLHIREGLEIVREDCFKKPLVVGKLLERVKHIMEGELGPKVINMPEIQCDEALPHQMQLDSFLQNSKIAHSEQPQGIARVQDLVAVEELVAVQDLVVVEELVAVKELIAVREIEDVQEKMAIQTVVQAQEAVMNELFVAEFVAKEETLAIDILPEQPVLAADTQKSPVMSGKRWW